MPLNPFEPNFYNIFPCGDGPQPPQPSPNPAPALDELFILHIFPGAGEFTAVRSSIRKRQYRPRPRPSSRVCSHTRVV